MNLRIAAGESLALLFELARGMESVSVCRVEGGESFCHRDRRLFFCHLRSEELLCRHMASSRTSWSPARFLAVVM